MHLDPYLIYSPFRWLRLSCSRGLGTSWWLYYSRILTSSAPCSEPEQLLRSVLTGCSSRISGFSKRPRVNLIVFSSDFCPEWWSSRHSWVVTTTILSQSRPSSCYRIFSCSIENTPLSSGSTLRCCKLFCWLYLLNSDTS